MLVLANDDGGLYSSLQDMWRRYMHSSPQIDCYFIKGRPDQSEEVLLEGDSLYMRIEEGYGEVPWKKTLAALRYFEPRFKDYAFVYRTNLSTHLHFPKYLEYCKSLPRQGLCSAVVHWNHEVNYPSGSGFTLSMDLAKRLLDDPPQHSIMDDVTVGIALAKWGIQIRSAPRIDFCKLFFKKEVLAKVATAGDAFQFRVKTPEKYRFHTDIEMHGWLYEVNYLTRTCSHT